jgi:16S rRNA (cytidine1402-2'-O)-methyltransferase
MSGTLYVVATPIGNLEDITLRALRVLRESNVIAAEDTRRTAKLLAHHGIRTPTLSFHSHNARARLPGLVARLEAGQRVALVSDAGSPAVSDPGVELVQACVERHINVDPIPGANAPLTAAIASGFPLNPLTVLGFPPYRSKDRTAWFGVINEISNTIVLFEAPHRIKATLTTMGDIMADRPIVLARELTKVHQEFLRGTAKELVEQLESPRGEFTIVIGPSLTDSKIVAYASDDEIAAEFGRMTDSGGLTRRQAVVSVARKLNQPVRSVYAAVERRRKYGV